MRQAERTGIVCALAGFTMLSLGDAIVKTMAGMWSPVAVAALRLAFGAAGLSLILLLGQGPRAFRPSHPWLQVARGACLAGVTLCFFSAVFVLPLAETMALTFVAPIFTALLAGPLLGERVRPVVWVASLIALGGVLLVLRPNLAEVGAVALLPLGAAAFFSLMVIANRASSGQGSILSMQVFIVSVAAPILTLAALGGHAAGIEALRIGPPHWSVIARCALVAVTASIAHWLIYLGTTRAGASTVAPMTYVQMIVASALGWLVFGDVPDAATIAGAAVIIGAGLLLWWRTPPGVQPPARQAD
jgi:drug/metabolite transporter (DMT)-like permease